MLSNIPLFKASMSHRHRIAEESRLFLEESAALTLTRERSSRMADICGLHKSVLSFRGGIFVHEHITVMAMNIPQYQLASLMLFYCWF